MAFGKPFFQSNLHSSILLNWGAQSLSSSYIQQSSVKISEKSENSNLFLLLCRPRSRVIHTHPISVGCDNNSADEANTGQ